jgi:hypothetical protein
VWLSRTPSGVRCAHFSTVITTSMVQDLNEKIADVDYMLRCTYRSRAKILQPLQIVFDVQQVVKQNHFRSEYSENPFRGINTCAENYVSFYTYSHFLAFALNFLYFVGNHRSQQFLKNLTRHYKFSLYYNFFCDNNITILTVRSFLIQGCDKRIFSGFC